MDELALLEAGPLADPVAHLVGLGRNSHGLNLRREALDERDIVLSKYRLW